MHRIVFNGFWAGTESDEFIGAAFLRPFPGLGGDAFAVGSKVSGRVSVFQLRDDDLPRLLEVMDQLTTIDGYVPGGVIFPDDDGQTIWARDNLTGRMNAFDGPSDRLGEALQLQDGQTLTASIITPVDGGWVAAAQDRDTLLYLADDPGGLRIAERVTDDANEAKSNVTGLSDLLPITVGGRDFLISASYSAPGVTAFEMTGGSLVQRDYIGAKDGMWANGISKLAAAEINGVSYVIALSADANALFSLRVNDQGVFFTADTLWDSRDTRFAGAQDMALFNWQGREFLVTGGRDAGLSLIEILPDGGLLHHRSIAQSADWDIGPVTQIEARLLSDTVQIMVTGSQAAGVAHLTVDLSDTGGRIVGTAGNDTLRGDALGNLIIGGAGNDRLRGLDGDDYLLAGTGSDALSGEEGADVFAFAADGQADKITDFQMGQDRIDLSGWGRLYTYADLTIAETGFGARILWRQERLDVYSDQGQPIEVSEWGADDFIF